MVWTQKHSENAVAAKARLRIEHAQAEPKIELHRKVRSSRVRARFRLQFRDELIGDSLTLSLYELPWKGRFVGANRQELSAAQICRALKAILNHEIRPQS